MTNIFSDHPRSKSWVEVLLLLYLALGIFLTPLLSDHTHLPFPFFSCHLRTFLLAASSSAHTKGRLCSASSACSHSGTDRLLFPKLNFCHASPSKNHLCLHSAAHHELGGTNVLLQPLPHTLFPSTNPTCGFWKKNKINLIFWYHTRIS